MEARDEFYPRNSQGRSQNTSETFKITKKQMKEKISSRQDFILIFGLERKIY